MYSYSEWAQLHNEQQEDGMDDDYLTPDDDDIEDDGSWLDDGYDDDGFDGGEPSGYSDEYDDSDRD